MNNYYKKAVAFLICTGGFAFSMEIQHQCEFDQPHPQKTIDAQNKTYNLTDDLIHEPPQSATCEMLLKLVSPHNRYPAAHIEPIISGISTEKALELWKAARSLEATAEKEYMLGQLRKFWPVRLVNVSQIINAGYSVEEAFNGFFRHVKLDIRRTPGMLQSFGSNTNLITLSLRANYIGNEGAKILGGVLAGNSTLTILNLDYNLIDAVGMKDLVGGLRKNSTLTTLTLGYNKIGDEGVAYLSELLKNNAKLKTLNLEFNMITDKGAAYLAEAWSENTTLCNLNLFDNFIFAQGARLLAGVLENKTTSTNLNLESNFIDIELEIDIKEVMKRVGLRKTSKVARPTMRGRFRLMVENYYSKDYETEEDQDRMLVADLLAERLKKLCRLKELQKKSLESQEGYLKYKFHSLMENEISLKTNLINIGAKNEIKTIFGKNYHRHIITTDHVINIALALKQRIPEDIENINKLDALIEKNQSQKQTGGHTIILEKTTFLIPENELSESEKNNSDSENEHNDDTVYTVYGVSEKPANTTDECACRLF